MEKSLRTGISFGLTSGVITTLGLVVGLSAGTGSKLAVVGGIVTIAIADALSDALGIHIAEESKVEHPPEAVWLATVATFVAKFIMALTFLIPILLWELSTAIVVSVVWGLCVLGALSFHLSRIQQVKPWKVIGEHLGIAAVVIIVTHALGEWVGAVFGRLAP